MDKKAWFIFIGIVVVVIGGLIFVKTGNQLDVSDIVKDGGANKILGPEERNGNLGDRVTGNKDAKVIMIEYGDYQCPGCKTAAPEARKIAKKYGDNLALVFRNYPIVQLHPNARAAAAIAESAGEQGKFWQMHDKLYENQEIWATASLQERNDVFLGYARELGLDIEKFKVDVASDRIARKLDFDVALAKAQGITGTPTFVINGKETKTENLEKEIVKALKEAGVETPESTEKTE